MRSVRVLGAALIAAAMLGAGCDTTVSTGHGGHAGTGGHPGMGGGGGHPGMGGGGGAPKCSVDADCNDENACTDDSCGPDGTCVHVAKADGVVCEGMGFAGVCAGGMCLAGDCGIPGDCPSMGPCETMGCGPGGQCLLTPLPDGTPTPGVMQVAGDCHEHVCIGGQEVNAVDATDLPTPPNDCQQAACDSTGTPSITPIPGKPACHTFMGSQAGVCDDSGNCAQCNTDADCLAVNDAGALHCTVGHVCQ